MDIKERMKWIYYAGMTREEFKTIKDDLWIQNRKKLLVYSIITIAALIGMCAVGTFNENVSSDIYPYFFALVFVILNLVYAFKFTKDIHLRQFLSLTNFDSVLFLMGIYIGVIMYPHERSTTFIVFILAIPLIFAIRPVYNVLMIVLYDSLFIILVYLYKDESAKHFDMINAVVYGVISIVTTSYMMYIMFDNIKIKHKMKILAETDQLTGLKNRTCYNLTLYEHVNRCRNTVSCIYMDINGLHELNNTKGHLEGDRMLVTVSEIFGNIFGRDYTYRIGGDEFVAFSVDTDDKIIAEKIQMLIEEIESKDYHAAAGFATHNKKDADIAALINKAEDNMYKAKRRFYSQKENDRRIRL